MMAGPSQSSIGAIDESMDRLKRSTQIQRVAGELPRGIVLLQEEARQEGYLFVERLVAEWKAGETRFDRDGEVLLVAFVDGAIAGIGGLTIDPVVPRALRMRRFYVRARFRREGIGRSLATALLEIAGPGRDVTVNAGTADAPAFWEALGFIPHRSGGHTHIRRA